jgi:hypothetical protein
MSVGQSWKSLSGVALQATHDDFVDGLTAEVDVR